MLHHINVSYEIAMQFAGIIINSKQKHKEDFQD